MKGGKFMYVTRMILVDGWPVYGVLENEVTSAFWEKFEEIKNANPNKKVTWTIWT